MLVPLAPRQTIDLAAAALSSGRGAGLPELLGLIQTLATRMDHISLGEISELIEQDPVVSMRLVSMANMIALNPGMTALTGVPHAIHQLGLQRVRSLAISLMLLKSSGARQNPSEQRQAATRVLCAGLISQACAQQVAAVDPEMVFVCATLRQLGRIILPVVSIDHYRHALAVAEEKSEAIAFREVFGLTPLELSRELLRPYKLPEEVRQALGEPAGAGGDADIPSAHGERLGALVDYGGRLTQIVLDVSLDAEAYQRKIDSLSAHFTDSLPNANDLVAGTLGAASERLTQFLQIPGASSGTEVMLRRIRARLFKPEETTESAAAPETTDSNPPNPVVAKAAATVAPKPASQPPVSTAPFPSPQPASTPSTPSRPPEPMLEAITLVPETVQPAVPGEPWLEVLRPVRAGFQADHCAVFLRASPSGPFLLAGGLGSFAAHFQDIASVHPAEKTVFSIALIRRETVVIHDSRTPSLRSFLPAWFQGDASTPAAFLLVPLSNGEQVAGLVLVGWNEARRIELNASHEAMLHLLGASAGRLLTGSSRVAFPRKAG